MKGESVYKGLMTLIPLKWKRTVFFFFFTTLGLSNMSPQENNVLKILFYTTDCIHLKNLSFKMV
jgi:hypothetical protein